LKTFLDNLTKEAKRGWRGIIDGFRYEDASLKTFLDNLTKEAKRGWRGIIEGFTHGHFWGVSLRWEFAIKLLPIFALLTCVFSYLIYSLLESEILDEVRRDMILHSKMTAPRVQSYAFEMEKIGDETYLNLYDAVFRDEKIEMPPIHTALVTNHILRVEKVRDVLIAASLFSFALVPIFAFLYSYFLARSIERVSRELATMNEKSLELITDEVAPRELKPMADSLNSLITRVKNHISYQHELFVGLAHELKTPLAVIRAKNDVALMKDRDVEKYKEILRDTNRIVNEMNSMSKSVLDLGRAEYTQFDAKSSFDLVKFLREKIADYEHLARREQRNLIAVINPPSFVVNSRQGLYEHILQNLFSNALKFTPHGKTIEIRAYKERGNFVIEVIDEGGGLPEGVDIFAPFSGKGRQKGVGLGLYLAHNAAIAIGGELTLKNRADGVEGTIATLTIQPERAL
jgi:two-component system OmpR family sensor kinase